MPRAPPRCPLAGVAHVPPAGLWPVPHPAGHAWSPAPSCHTSSSLTPAWSTKPSHVSPHRRRTWDPSSCQSGRPVTSDARPALTGSRRTVSSVGRLANRVRRPRSPEPPPAQAAGPDGPRTQRPQRTRRAPPGRPPGSGAPAPLPVARWMIYSSLPRAHGGNRAPCPSALPSRIAGVLTGVTRTPPPGNPVLVPVSERVLLELSWAGGLAFAFPTACFRAHPRKSTYRQASPLRLTCHRGCRSRVALPSSVESTWLSHPLAVPNGAAHEGLLSQPLPSGPLKLHPGGSSRGPVATSCLATTGERVSAGARPCHVPVSDVQGLSRPHALADTYFPSFDGSRAGVCEAAPLRWG